MERIYNAAKAAIEVYGTHWLRPALESRYRCLLRSDRRVREMILDRQFGDIEKVMKDIK